MDLWRIVCAFIRYTSFQPQVIISYLKLQLRSTQLRVNTALPENLKLRGGGS